MPYILNLGSVHAHLIINHYYSYSHSFTQDPRPTSFLFGDQTDNNRWNLNAVVISHFNYSCWLDLQDEEDSSINKCENLMLIASVLVLVFVFLQRLHFVCVDVLVAAMWVLVLQIKRLATTQVENSSISWIEDNTPLANSLPEILSILPVQCHILSHFKIILKGQPKRLA